MHIIARIRTDFPDKFGVPRQSGLAAALRGKVVFEPAFRSPEAVRRLEEFSHIWLLWEFSRARREGWHATVRPPRLGGNERVGVFASRSPFRPNPIGLSAVRLERVALEPQDGPVLYVAGVDMLDGTPVYDIKPYVPLTDCIADATEGYTKTTRAHALEVVFPPALLAQVPADKREALLSVLAQDPRPGYLQEDARRVYGVPFAGLDVKFRVEGQRLIVCGLEAVG